MTYGRPTNTEISELWRAIARARRREGAPAADVRQAYTNAKIYEHRPRNDITRGFRERRLI